MNETWITVDECKLYEVSSLGNVRRAVGGQGAVAGKVLSWHTNTSNGYATVRLVSDGKSRGVAVHKLVTRAFIGQRPEGMVTRHLDGNKLNNAATNLRYGTMTENNRDKIRHRTSSVGCKLDMAAANVIRRLKAEGGRATAIARLYGICTSHVYRICAGIMWPQEASNRAEGKATQ